MDVAEAWQMGRALMDRHGLQEWRLTISRARRQAGICRADRREIAISGPLTAIHPEAEVRDTILHEIAHALVGPHHGHDEVWRAKALSIGSSGRRTSSPDVPTIEGAWVGTCPAGHRKTRHRRPERPSSCGQCCPTFDPAHLLTWTHHGQPVEMSARYEAELARLARSAGLAGVGSGGAGEATAGTTPQPPVVRIGDRVRVAVPGHRYDGVCGTLVKRGRTRFHLRIEEGILTVPFHLVEPVG